MLKWNRILSNIVIISALIALILSCGNKQEKETSADSSDYYTDSVKSADDVMIYYDVYGEGDRALVLIHGWCCDDSYWDEQVDAFKDHYKIVTLDLAGHGRSGMEREIYSMQAYGSDVAAVVNKLDLDDIILVGHSMGGIVSLEAAKQLSGKITAIIGVDTFQDLARKLPEEQIQQVLFQFQTNFEGFVKQFMLSTFPEDADTALSRWITDDMSSAPVNVGVGSMQNYLNYDAQTELEEFSIPVRCINADKFPTNIEGNQELLESFEVTYMPGYGHFLHMENPELFNQHLQEIIYEFWQKENTE